MAFTDGELKRIEIIETAINDLQVALTKVLTKQQMTQLLLIKQQEINALKTRVTALESQIEVLQGQIA